APHSPFRVRRCLFSTSPRAPLMTNDATNEGKSRLVTVIGGANGIGAATCRILCARGFRVLVADIDGQNARSLANALGAIAAEVDVLDAESIARIAATAEEHGPVYGLVNAAAIFAPQRPPEELP